MKKEIPHTTLNGSDMFCKNCGREFPISCPISLGELIDMMEGFNNLHKNCKKNESETESAPVYNAFPNHHYVVE